MRFLGLEDGGAGDWVEAQESQKFAAVYHLGVIGHQLDEEGLQRQATCLDEVGLQLVHHGIQHLGHRQTERQRDRETERQRDRQTERQTDRQTDRQRETDRHRERQTDRHRQRGRRINTKRVGESARQW